MRFDVSLRLCRRNMFYNKARSMLTILGLVIGTISIVLMLSLGLGIGQSYKTNIMQNSDLTTIYVNRGVDAKTNGELNITRDSVDAFKKIENVKAASPVYTVDFFATIGGYQGSITVIAVDFEVLKSIGLNVLDGNFPAEGDPVSLLVGKGVSTLFSNPADNTQSDSSSVNFLSMPLYVCYDSEAYRKAQQSGEQLPDENYIAVCGIVGSETGDSEIDYNCYADLQALEILFDEYFGEKWPYTLADSNGNPYYPRAFSQARVIVDDISNVAEVQDEIEEMGFNTASSMSSLNRALEHAKELQFFFGAIGTVTLIVSAIGTANTMLTNLYERKTDIAVYRALGCSKNDLLMMFLMESAIMGLMSGIIGATVSLIASYFINVLYKSTITVVPIWLWLGSALFTAVIGILSGIIPAYKATKVSVNKLFV